MRDLITYVYWFCAGYVVTSFLSPEFVLLVEFVWINRTEATSYLLCRHSKTKDPIVVWAVKQEKALTIFLCELILILQWSYVEHLREVADL